jgi:hypothetical protein
MGWTTVADAVARRIGGRQTDGANEERALLARVGASLFAAGGTLGLVSLTLAGGGDRDAGAIATVSLAAYALALVELAGLDRLPRWAFPALTACGTGLVSAAIAFGGQSASFYVLFYVWVVLYAAYFFGAPQVTAQVVLASAAYAAVLALGAGGPLAPLAWLLTTATLAVAAALVVLLRRRLERLAEDRAATRRLVDETLERDVHPLFLVEEDYRLALLDAEIAFVGASRLGPPPTVRSGRWPRGCCPEER